MNPLIRYAVNCVSCGMPTFKAYPGPRCDRCHREWETVTRILEDHPDLRKFEEFAESFYGDEFSDA